MSRKFKLLRIINFLFILSIIFFNSGRIFSSEEKKFEPSGKLISIGTHKLHFHCSGKGEKTFILEAGIGANHLDWSKLQPKLSKRFKVCSYDRTGYGWSERGPKPRDAETISIELAKAIDNLSLSTPIIIVGHSFGGIIAMVMQKKFSNLVDSIVLLDSMHPEQYERFEKNNIDVPVEPTRAIIYSSPDVLTYGIPDEKKKEAYFLAKTEKTRSFMYNEMRNMEKSLKQVNFVKNKKTLVFTHARRDWDSHSIDGKMEDIWFDLQNDLAKKLDGELVVVPDAGHQMQLENYNFINKKLLEFSENF